MHPIKSHQGRIRIGIPPRLWSYYILCMFTENVSDA